MVIHCVDYVPGDLGCAGWLELGGMSWGFQGTLGGGCAVGVAGAEGVAG